MEPHTFEYSESDFIHQTAQWVDRLAPQESELDKQLLQRWQEAVDAGAFRYKVDQIDMRTIPGPKKYVAYLNVLRGTERRKPQPITSIKQPVNPDGFNFTKVKANETIFDLKLKSSTTNGSILKGQEDGKSSNGLNNEARHSIMINNSPLNTGHCLLLPEKDLCKPQVLTETALKLALETILLSRNRGFSLGFNSLLAFASVNHLHWHIIYIPQQLMAHHCPVRHLAGCFHEVTCYPVHGFAVQLHGSTIEEVARQAHRITSYLYENDVAHNAFMCRGVAFGEEASSSLTTIRFFIWPRKKFLEDPADEPFNLACIELPGFLAMKYPKSYESFTETDVDDIFKTNALDPADYNKIRDHVISLGSQSGSNIDGKQ